MRLALSAATIYRGGSSEFECVFITTGESLTHLSWPPISRRTGNGSKTGEQPEASRRANKRTAKKRESLFERIMRVSISEKGRDR